MISTYQERAMQVI